ncbi:MAG: hypothetical protein KDC10_14580, partial [Calditrichaeota bacterium]|nr:hypothetical protein [Calditrichota bacterium]
VPAGWTLWTDGNAGIADGRFNANTVDGSARLTHIVPNSADLAQLSFSYTGSLNTAYWGQNNGLEFNLAGGEWFSIRLAYSQYNWGNYAIALVGSNSGYLQQDAYPFTAGEYHIQVSLSDGAFSSTAINASTQEVLYDYTISVPGFTLAELEDVSFTVDATTGNNVHMDDLCVGIMSIDTNLYTQCNDLNDNAVPDGWSLWTDQSAEISNGRFNANLIDGSGKLWHPVPNGADLDQISFSYTGNLQYAYWGQNTGLEFEMANGDWYSVRLAYSEYNWGNYAIALVGSTSGYLQEATYPFIPGEYAVEIEIRDGSFSSRATNLSSMQVLYDYTISVPGFLVADLEQVAFSVDTTTDNGTWSDDLCVEVEAHLAAVTGLSIATLPDYTVQLDWDPVLDIYGQIAPVDYYLVFYNEQNYMLENDWYYLTSTDQLSVQHLRAAQFSDQILYRVSAWRGSNPQALGLTVGMPLHQCKAILAAR